MSFTAQLGTSSSQLGNIEPGQGAVETPTSVFGPGSSNTTPNTTLPVPSFTSPGTVRVDPFLQFTPLTSGSTTSVSTVFSSNVTAGSTIVFVGVAANTSAAPTSCTDTLGNTYTRVRAFQSVSYRCEMWATYNIASGGANTVTINGWTSPFALQGLSYEFALGPNAKTCDNNTGTGNSTGSVSSTGIMGVMVLVNKNNTGGTFTRGVNFKHQAGGPSMFTMCGTVMDFGSSTGNFTPTNDGINVIGMFTDVEGQTVGTVAGAATVSGVGFPLYSGGDIILEDGSGDILLETGDFVLLEDTTSGGTGSVTGAATVSGVGVSIASGAGSVAGVATVTAVGVGLSAVTGTGTTALPVPSFTGAGIWTNPTGLWDQQAVEDLEQADIQTDRLQQMAIEDLELYDLPIDRMDQLAVEDIEVPRDRFVNLDQYCVEILIPFDCNLTPPLTLPPGCPPDEIEGTGSSSAGCADSPATGTATTKAGCKPTIRNS